MLALIRIFKFKRRCGLTVFQAMRAAFDAMKRDRYYKGPIL